MDSRKPFRRPAPSPVGAPRSEPNQVSSDQLLGSCGCLVIRHAGRDYRLQRTRNGKLILTA
jgi:hemin uptake protein HemP